MLFYRTTHKLPLKFYWELCKIAQVKFDFHIGLFLIFVLILFFLYGHVHLFYVHVGDVCACVSSNMRMLIYSHVLTYVNARMRARACVRACLFGKCTCPPPTPTPSRPVQHSTVLAEEDLLTLLKSKRHSLRCHDFLVHAYLLRMCTNVVDFRVMRRLCRREWNWQRNWQSVNQHSWDPWQWTTWSRRVTYNGEYNESIGSWIFMPMQIFIYVARNWENQNFLVINRFKCKYVSFISNCYNNLNI